MISHMKQRCCGTESHSTFFVLYAHKVYLKIKEEIMMTELQELLDAVNGEIYGVWF